MIRIKNPDLLRERVQKIESKIKAIVNKKYNANKFPRYPWYKGPIQKSKVERLLYDRARYLDSMFTGTPEEVKRFEMLNDKFLRMAGDMRVRAAMLWESMQGMKKREGYDDAYEVEGVLYVDTWREVLKLPNDQYYGSDFEFMSEIIQMVIPDTLNPARCYYGVDGVDLASGNTDGIISLTDSMEDGHSWAEGSLCHPALSHICVCCPIHFLCADNPYSIPDLLRMDDFRTRIVLEITHCETQSEENTSAGPMGGLLSPEEPRKELWEENNSKLFVKQK